MKTKTGVVLFVVLVVASALLVNVLTRRIYAAATLKTERKPVTIVYQTTFPDGNTIETMEAYRKDGSVARIFPDHAGEVASHRLVEDVVTRSSTAIDLLSRSRSTIPRSDEEIKRSTRWTYNCESQFRIPNTSLTCESLSERRFNQSLVRATLTVVHKDGSVLRSVQTVAPDLEFLVIDEQDYQGDRLVQSRRAKSLVVGDPDPSLFDIPSDFPAKGYTSYREAELKARDRAVSPKAKAQWQKKEADLNQ